MPTSLSTALERYQAALEDLDQTEAAIDVEQVLAVLNARDTVQVALKQQSPVPNSQLQKVIKLDQALRGKTELIAKAVNYQTAEQFAQWRESVHPSADAWWWRLERIAPHHPWDQFDWLWRSLTIAGWTANLSLLVNIAGRFFSQGAGLAGAAAVILPSILALLQVRSELTKSGHEGFDKLLTQLKIPTYLREEAMAVSTLLMSVFLIFFWLSLPDISQIYNRLGLENYRVRKLGTAEQEYLRAIALDENNVDAHYNLGNLYEDRQNFKKAEEHYKIAVGGDVPEAYNNLSRLYIQKQKYPQAVALLTQGLALASEQQSFPDVRYNLLKNMGWIRFKQGRYAEAEQTLKAAIGIAENPETAQYIANHASAHCVLAQVLDQQKQSTALVHWQECCQGGSRFNSDEDTWLHLAHQQLKKAGKECSNTGI